MLIHVIVELGFWTGRQR